VGDGQYPHYLPAGGPVQGAVFLCRDLIGRYESALLTRIPARSLVTGSRGALLYSGRRQDSFRGAVMNSVNTSPAASTPIYICDRCGTEMLDLHCKLRCPACGFMRDCSDP